MVVSKTPISAPDERERSFRFRSAIIKLFFIVAFAAVGFRLVQVQLVDAGTYKEIARRQYEQKFTVPAERGNIFDRNGNVLVSNTKFVSFAADPKIVGGRAERVASTFARVFGKPSSFYAGKLAVSNRRFVWMERSVRPSVAASIERARLPGIVMIDEPKRLYHYDDLAGTLIGFTDVDSRGISGLELSLDADLRGADGSVIMRQDGLGRTYSNVDYPRVKPVNGLDALLTIDLNLQSVVEEELRRGIERDEADGGLAVFMNPRTGEILALAVSPGVNPNRPNRTDLALARNRVITDIFEPGSVFKIVTASAAFEHHIIPPEKKYFAEHGAMKVRFGTYVRTIRDTHGHGWITFREAIEVSSNIVMAKAATEIGDELLFTTARDFGFGMLTGVDMAGEVRGILKHPDTWSRTTLQTMSYGYEVAVTPLQVLMAYGAIANGGVLMRPYVVTAPRNESGELVHQQRSEVVRRVVSQETASLMRLAFEGVVERGTAKDVAIPGIRVGGKTGTARKVIDGSYARGQYTASFVGFFPVDDPKVVGLVMMDNPRNRGYYGGITSGPVFRAIAERIVNTSAHISRTVMTSRDPLEDKHIAVPDLRNMNPEAAEEMLHRLGLDVRTFGSGRLVVRQKPDPGHILNEGDLVNLAIGSADQTANGVMRIPDVRGLSVRRALSRMTVDDFDVVVKGSGIVRRQAPRAGTKKMPGATVTLFCEPAPLGHVVLF